jgi:hypothetical protein
VPAPGRCAPAMLGCTLEKGDEASSLHIFEFRRCQLINDLQMVCQELRIHFPQDFSDHTSCI